MIPEGTVIIGGEEQKKAWGTTQPVVRAPHCEAHVLIVEQGGYCSVHYHEHREQYIFVVSGLVQFRLFDVAGRETHRLLFGSGAKIECDPQVRHQFFAETDCILVEIYRPSEPQETLRHEDIVRLSEGGMTPPATPPTLPGDHHT